jgi:hypothetical protein
MPILFHFRFLRWVLLKSWSCSRYIGCCMRCCQRFGGKCYHHREGKAISEARLLTVEVPRFQDNRHIKGGKIVYSLAAFIPQEILLVRISESTYWAGKIMTSWGIEPPNFPLVANCATPYPVSIRIWS